VNEEGLAHFLHFVLQIAFFRHFSRVASMRKICNRRTEPVDVEKSLDDLW